MNRALFRSYIGSYLFNAPLFAFYSILQFILVKDLKATAFQITLLISLKPMVALLSSYWSAFIANRQDRLKKNIFWACLIGILPTLAFPFTQNNWFLIFAFTLYFFTERAIIPAWMEILNLGLNKERASKAVATGSMVSFVAASLIPLFLGPLLDAYFWIWKWIFPLMGLCSLARIFCLTSWTLPVSPPNVPSQPQALRAHLAHPWKTSWQLLRKRKDFALYQTIFIFGGLGLMVMQPALPRFINEVLGLSYTELALAFALCKGMGFALANPLWSAKIHKSNIFRFCALVTLVAAGSITCILASSVFSVAIYAAFFLYGVMQAGSQLSWQMGGPLFSGAQDSSPYTGVNIILVGVRGCIGPMAGGFFLSAFGLTAPFVLGAILCLSGTFVGYLASQKNPSLELVE